MNPPPITCPHTAREFARFYRDIAQQLDATADQLERGRVRSFSRSIDAMRSGKYAHALRHNGLSETAAIAMTARTLHLPKDTVKTHLLRIRDTIKENRAMRKRHRAASLRDKRYSIRQVAEILSEPKSTVAGWLSSPKPTQQQTDHKANPSSQSTRTG